MAYTVDWLTKIVTVPLADLTLVSGINYTLDVDIAHDELRNLEWNFSDGLWAPAIIEFINTQVLSGQSYSPIVKMINGYTWDIDATNIVVSLTGSNTNFLDTYIPGNGVSVLANNSAGKITVASGSGLSAEQATQLVELWKLSGLDIANPMNVTPTSRTAGDIGLDITGDGLTTTTVTRQ